MKLFTLKNTVKTLLQVLLMVVRTGAAIIDFICIKCMLPLENPLSAPLAKEAKAKAIKHSPVINNNPDKREQVIQEIISSWTGLKVLSIARDRAAFESIEEGREVVRLHPDRHLYAVAKPTRRENLMRIENVLRALPNERLFEIQRRARLINQGYAV